MKARSYRVFQPHAALRGVVECFRVDQRAGPLASPIPFRILPDGSAHLIFRVYGEHGDVLTRSYGSEVCELRFVGARSVYKDIDLRRRALTLIVRFRPGGAYAFLPFPAGDLTDCAFDLDDLWRAESARLLERLAGAGTVQAQIRVLEDALLHRLMQASPLDKAVGYAVGLVETSKGRVSVQALADQVGITERHLRNRFQERVGLSPKRYARIVRVKNALDLARQEHLPGWAVVALAAGFYDQAHMIREFQALLGDSPAAYFKHC